MCTAEMGNVKDSTSVVKFPDSLERLENVKIRIRCPHLKPVRLQLDSAAAEDVEALNNIIMHPRM